MEEVDKGCPMTRIGVSGWVFLLVLAHPGSPGPKNVKWLCVCVCCLYHFIQCDSHSTVLYFTLRYHLDISFQVCRTVWMWWICITTTCKRATSNSCCNTSVAVVQMFSAPVNDYLQPSSITLLPTHQSLSAMLVHASVVSNQLLLSTASLVTPSVLLQNCWRLHQCTNNMSSAMVGPPNFSI